MKNKKDKNTYLVRNRVDPCGDQWIAENDLAYRRQYGDKELKEALNLYSKIISTRPNTLEAQYSRSQIMNIVDTVVPAEEIISAQMNLAYKYLNENFE